MASDLLNLEKGQGYAQGDIINKISPRFHRTSARDLYKLIQILKRSKSGKLF